jgi:hypothetical protein
MGEVESTTGASVVENGANTVPDGSEVAKFAALLKEENAAKHPEPDDTEETTPIAAAKKSETKESSADLEAMRRAYYAGDVAKLAELLGADVKAAKITDSKWAKYRQRKTEASRSLDSQRSALEQERTTFAAEKESVSQIKAWQESIEQAIKNEDYERAIELAIKGKKINEVIDALTEDYNNPSNREIRRMRREREDEKSRLDAERQEFTKQQQLTQQRVETAAYVAKLKSSVASIPVAVPFLEKYGDEFVTLVFNEVGRRHRTGEDTSTEKATRAVLKNQVNAYDKMAEVIEGIREHLGQTGTAKPKSVQGNQGARLSPRKPTTSSQGGAAPAKPLTEQEEVNYWAKQLKAENASRRAG